MQCPHCGQEHPKDLKFCPRTGKLIEQQHHCPACGELIEPAWQHCGFCGAVLDHQNPPTTSPKVSTFVQATAQPQPVKKAALPAAKVKIPGKIPVILTLIGAGFVLIAIATRFIPTAGGLPSASAIPTQIQAITPTNLPTLTVPLPSATFIPEAESLPAPVFAGLPVTEEQTWKISLPPGWERTQSVPQGLDVGFQKKLDGSQTATLYFHHEIMPAGAGEPPTDTSDMQRQWDTMLANQYTDIQTVNGVVPPVNGRILVNGTYELTDNGEKVRRLYTYFLSGRTAFVVQSSAPPDQWDAALVDFEIMLASLQPGDSAPTPGIVSDQAAVDSLKSGLTTLLSSFPSGWSSSLRDLSISPASSTSKRTLSISLSFERQDIGAIYQATKQVFGLLKSGGSQTDLNSLPAETQKAAAYSAEFIKYLGEGWGFGWSYVTNCSPPIELYTLIILDASGKKVGSVSISSADAADVLSGKITTADSQKIASMYVFE